MVDESLEEQLRRLSVETHKPSPQHAQDTPPKRRLSFWKKGVLFLGALAVAGTAYQTISSVKEDDRSLEVVAQDTRYIPDSVPTTPSPEPKPTNTPTFTAIPTPISTNTPTDTLIYYKPTYTPIPPPNTPIPSLSTQTSHDVLFHETFDWGLEGRTWYGIRRISLDNEIFKWNSDETWKIHYGEWKITEKAFHGKVNWVKRYPGSCAFAGDTSWSNYILELDAKADKFEGETTVFAPYSPLQQFHVFFRVQNVDKEMHGQYCLLNVYYFDENECKPTLLRIDGDKTYYLYSSSYKSNFVTLESDWIHVKIMAWEDIVRIWLNEKKIIDIIDPKMIKSGKIGVGAYMCLSTRFDNVTVSDISKTPDRMLSKRLDYRNMSVVGSSFFPRSSQSERSGHIEDKVMFAAPTSTPVPPTPRSTPTPIKITYPENIVSRTNQILEKLHSLYPIKHYGPNAWDLTTSEKELEQYLKLFAHYGAKNEKDREFYRMLQKEYNFLLRELHEEAKKKDAELQKRHHRIYQEMVAFNQRIRFPGGADIDKINRYRRELQNIKDQYSENELLKKYFRK